MAILKHSASKSSNYQKAVDYVLYEHDETTGLPLKDDAGNLTPPPQHLYRRHKLRSGYLR